MWLTKWLLSAVPAVPHRATEWLVNNKWEGSERFDRELIWFDIAEFACSDWEEPRRMWLNTNNWQRCSNLETQNIRNKTDKYSLSNLWVRQRVVFCKIVDEIRTSIKTVFGKYLLYNVQHVSGLIMSHNQAHIRIFNKISIAHNTLYWTDWYRNIRVLTIILMFEGRNKNILK